MIRIALGSWLCLATVCAAAPSLDSTLKAVEKRYNSAQSLKLQFSETYAAPRRATHTESGTLSLRKPGRMRWDYSSPAGKLFLSDGKSVYLYTPETHRAERSKLKETEDMRAPLAFLLGKLNFWKEFKRFDLRQDSAGLWIDAVPNSDSLPYSKVEFLVTPQFQIGRLRVIGWDQSILDFTFRDEKLNAPLDAALFVFHPSPGTEVVEANP